MQLIDVPPGTMVRITGVVIGPATAPGKKDNHSILIYTPSSRESSAQWAIYERTEVEPIGSPMHPDDLQALKGSSDTRKTKNKTPVMKVA